MGTSKSSGTQERGEILSLNLKICKSLDAGYLPLNGVKRPFQADNIKSLKNGIYIFI
ncbi:MAG: hypothetical protein Ta2B_22910 [Termitinemataceae bacterium]|nr:MAG: hypothetical protein Ta2B_22910 [Termitinemataceae bacterium]